MITEQKMLIYQILSTLPLEVVVKLEDAKKCLPYSRMLSVEWQMLREEYIHMIADKPNRMRYPIDIYPQKNLIKVTDSCTLRHLLKHLPLMFTEEVVRSVYRGNCKVKCCVL